MQLNTIPLWLNKLGGLISRFIVLCGDHLCKFVVNKPLSVSFLSLFCVRTIQAILIQEEVKHWCGRRHTEHRVYRSLWFYHYLRKHVLPIFSWISMTYLLPGSYRLPNTRVDHALDFRIMSHGSYTKSPLLNMW